MSRLKALLRAATRLIIYKSRSSPLEMEVTQPPDCSGLNAEPDIANDQQSEVMKDPHTQAMGAVDSPAALHDSKPHDDKKDSQTPSPEHEEDPSALDTGSPPTTSTQSPTSTSSDSDATSGDDSSMHDYNMDTDIIRDLRIKGYSPSAGQWSTKYKSAQTAVHTLRVITWNVDFMQNDTASRVSCILDHLRDVVLSKTPKPSCVLLQELDYASFAAVLANRWVREHFSITPPNIKRWSASYGVATLVSRHANILRSQMLQFHRTTMGRTALLVDIEMYVPGCREGEKRAVRIANTHLESLPIGERMRPVQLCAIADLLREEGLSGGWSGDQDIHDVAGLQDACRDPSAVTWGFQPPSRYPPGRLDRIFHLERGLVVEPVQVIGKGLKTKRGMWASDHYGLMTTIKLAPSTHDGCACS
ncbi:Endonuclease/exonuclease/phosphatase [Daedaleopsis nitida]|nr:Endonuclease/exonuclease/phosphatase [Daedaleopsis nitida]